MVLQMAKITSITELKNPNFIKPIEINYTLAGQKRKWEAVISYDSVSVLLWHKERDAFVLVKQFRPPVLNATQKDGYTYELCAGIIDKDASDIQIAKEEIFEECGYDVPLKNLEKVTTFYPSVGVTGAYQTLYYAEINESMKISEGGGLEDENIEVIYLPIKESKKFMFDESYQKTPGMMMAFYWFFENRAS
jgi:UDP-sugar diphosphatase